MTKDKETILCEFVVGGKRGHKKLSEVSIIESLYLLTDMYSHLTFYYTKINNSSKIEGIEFNNKIIFGIKFNVDSTHFIQKIKLGKQAYFDSFKLQNRIMPDIATDKNNNILCKQYISFIEITYKDKIYKIGCEGQQCSLNNNDYYLETEKILKPCVISGVGLSSSGLFCLQMIQAHTGIIDDKAITHFSYGRRDIGFVESKIDTNTFKTDFAKKIFIDTLKGKKQNVRIEDIEDIKKYGGK